MEEYERSGRAFIAYRGNKFAAQALKTRLNDFNYSSYSVKSKTVNAKDGDKVIFAKIVISEYIEDRDPYMCRNVLAVSGYNQTDLKYSDARIGYDISDQDRYHYTFNYKYNEEGIGMFKDLSNIHFCTAIFDNTKDMLIAGRTTCRESNDGDRFTKLYVGYTRDDNEIMYSNVEGVLQTFCDEIIELPENSYVQNDTIYNFNGDVIKELRGNKANNQQLIRNTKENANSLINGLNELLIAVTNESVKTKIEENVDEYLNSDDPKKKIEDYIVKELDTDTKKQVLEIIKKELEEQKVEDTVGNKLEDIFNTKLDEYTKKIQLPVIHIVKLNDTVLGQTQGGFYHKKFDEVLSYVQLDEPVMLIGPAGSGKNHAIGQIAQALGLKMYYTNNASNEFKLTGFIDAGGTYRDTEFYKAFKNGGIFFLDEIDNSDPSALIAINSALANGYMAFPHETIDKHPDFRMVAAANTWGKGSDLQYVGRNALDAATLDRFDNVFFDYDMDLERALYPNEEVLKFMWSLRDATYETKIPHIVSTRGIGKVYKKEVNGIPVENILRTNIVRNLGQDDLNTLLGSMQNINGQNKYYKAAKTLRLTR